MTLDDAIKHEEEVAKEKQYEYQECLAMHDMENAEECGRCGEEHRQLAEWLKELKQLREKELFINKPCISSEVCEHDKNKVLDKIRAEVIKESFPEDEETSFCKILYLGDVLQIIDKYKAESEGT